MGFYLRGYVAHFGCEPIVRPRNTFGIPATVSSFAFRTRSRLHKALAGHLLTLTPRPRWLQADLSEMNCDVRHPTRR